MSKELVFGHQKSWYRRNRAAKAFSYYENKMGADTEAVALGEPNEETQFVLDYFDEPALRVITKASDEVDSVMLVDHNEPQQSVSDIADVTVSHVVDHHRIAGFDTAQPLFYRAEPLGCCSTVIYKLFKEKWHWNSSQVSWINVICNHFRYITLKVPNHNGNWRGSC